MKKKLILFDMDGTIYLGDQIFPYSKEVFDFLKRKNINYVFLTNNSSHDIEFYLNKVQNMGVECTIDNFYSSIETTITQLKENNAKTIYVVGNECLVNKLKPHFNIVEKYDENTKIDAVVAGFYTELVYKRLQDACLFLESQDCAFYATNGDFRCPIEDNKFIPDCGGMIEWMRLCTGKKATVLGKPNPRMIYDLMDKYGVNKEETLCVGDRLYTDIAVGNNAGVDSVCVLSGESSLEDIKKSEHKPTYILNSIKDLIEILD